MDKDTTKTTFNELFSVLDEKFFSKIIEDNQLDKYVKKLYFDVFVKLLVTAQLKELDSLGHVSLFFKNEEEFHKHLGFDSISKSQLSRKQSQKGFRCAR